MSKKIVGINLSEQEIKKIEEVLISHGKNPEKKKSEFIRGLVNTFDSDSFYFSDLQLEKLQVEFENLSRVGGNLNQLLYHLNIEHIEFIKGNLNDYCLNSDDFAETINELHKIVIELKSELRKIAKQKRVGY
tara:strand:- start:23391 stop:23786 length:396 start_codon:yes stop_codon:yes gene_type:complete